MQSDGYTAISHNHLTDHLKQQLKINQPLKKNQYFSQNHHFEEQSKTSKKQSKQSNFDLLSILYYFLEDDLFPFSHYQQIIRKMFSGNSRSTIGSQQLERMTRCEDKPMKASSIVSTEDAIYCGSEVDRILRKEKSAILKESLEEKIKNMKLICEKVKKKNINVKTPSNLVPISKGETSEKMNPTYTYTVSKPIHQRSTQQSQTSSTKESFQGKLDIFLKKSKETPMPVQEAQHLQSLKEVREIDSFVLDDDQQLEKDESFVEQHGSAVLNWGVCIGKASEFKVLKYIDEGIYGKVYLAQSHRNGAIYSIKSIYRSTIDDNGLQQLIRQIKIQNFLNHPHIVHLYHFFVDEQAAYLVLQPCLGRNLYQNLKQAGKFSQSIVRQYMKQVCQGIQFMHRNDILHRDLKPENILLHQNMIKICDFGWAVHSPLLRGTQCGTPLYTSPQIVSKVPYDSKIDIWSIGILTYELLYGNIPFQIRNQHDMTKIIEQQVYFSRDPSVSQVAKKFISSCLQKNPNDRPTARQLLQHQFMQKQQQMYRMTIS